MHRILIVILISSVVLLPSLLADEASFQINRGDTIASVLQKQIGQRVSVTLSSGTELTGIVSSVGDEVIHLSELSGKEFYDAIVELDQIAAVVVRVRGANRS